MSQDKNSSRRSWKDGITVPGELSVLAQYQGQALAQRRLRSGVECDLVTQIEVVQSKLEGAVAIH